MSVIDRPAALLSVALLVFAPSIGLEIAGGAPQAPAGSEGNQ